MQNVSRVLISKHLFEIFQTDCLIQANCNSQDYREYSDIGILSSNKPRWKPTERNSICYTKSVLY